MLIRLLLAHIIADFPLQTNSIYNWKEKSKLGILLHVSIHFLTSYFILYKFLNLKLLGVITLITIIHFSQDWIKLYLQNKFEIFNRISAFILDQILHFCVIFLVFYALAPVMFGFISPFLKPLSYNDNIGLLFAVSILSSFGGCVAIYFIDKSILKRKLVYKKELSGLLERFLIPIVIFFKMNIIYLISIIVLRGLYYYLYNNKKEFKIIRTINLVLSPIIALILSLILFLF